MQHDITKLCADSLRSFLSDNHGIKLKSGHAHEIVAAFFGYKSKISLVANETYPLTNLDQAEFILLNPPVSFVDQRIQNLDGLPSDLPSVSDLASGVYSPIRNDDRFREKIWPNKEDVFQRTKKHFVSDAYYFSNPQKAKRERDVISYFLATVGVSFKEEELESPEQDSFIDVSFRDASFQIKERTSQSAAYARFPRQMGDAWKNPNSFEGGINSKDFKDAFQGEDIEYKSAYEEALKVATGAAKKYREKEKIDLLIHDTNTRVLQITEDDILSDKFKELGFRSVLHQSEYGRQASILHSSENSPEFVRNLDKRIFVYPVNANQKAQEKSLFRDLAISLAEERLDQHIGHWRMNPAPQWITEVEMETTEAEILLTVTFDYPTDTGKRSRYSKVDIKLPRIAGNIGYGRPEIMPTFYTG